MGLFKKTPEQLVEKAAYAFETGKKERAFALFSEAAEANYGLAWHGLAACYENGWGVEADGKKAVDSYHKAASCGVDEAWVKLAWFYRHGIGTEESMYRAIYCYEQAAARGSVRAMFELGEIHSCGIEVITDKKEGLKWYQMAAHLGDRNAMAALGEMYCMGNGVKKSKEMARAYYEKVIENPSEAELTPAVTRARIWLLLRDDMEALCDYEWEDAAEEACWEGEFELCCKLCEYAAEIDENMNLEKEGDPYGGRADRLVYLYHTAREMLKAKAGEAVCDTAEDYWELAQEMENYGCQEAANHYFQKAAELGMARGLNALGNSYLSGEGIPADEEKGVALIREAAEKGNMQALRNLGYFYADGKYGFPKDSARAKEYLKKAVEAGNDSAANKLGVIYEEEEKNIEEAVRWYEKGMELGNGYAAYNLAWIYRKKESGYFDFDKAIFYYKKAAELKHASSCQELGALYLFGEKVKADYDLAEEYLTDAAIYGDKKCYSCLGELYHQEDYGKADTAAAFFWIKKAAEEGSGIAQYVVGIYYDSMAKNFDKGNIAELKKQAKRWMEKAAVQGEKGALRWLREHQS